MDYPPEYIGHLQQKLTLLTTYLLPLRTVRPQLISRIRREAEILSPCHVRLHLLRPTARS